MVDWVRFVRRAVRGLVRAAPRDAAILAEATLLLAAAQLAVQFVPFRIVLPRRATLAAAESVAAAPSRAIARVRWAVEAAAARVPWTAPCLPQALTARLMLRRRGVPSTLHLGVRKDSENALVAHAWLCAGAKVVTGGPGRQSFAEIARLG